MRTQVMWMTCAVSLMAAGCGSEGQGGQKVQEGQGVQGVQEVPEVQGVQGEQEAAMPVPDVGPVVVIETAKGTIEFETYPKEAPKTVEHILALVRRNFYNGMRVHRVDEGFVVQFGDPLSRDMSKRRLWGTGGSGTPIGVSEVSPKHTHGIGAVATAHSGDPRWADSQMYITLAPQHRLDGEYTVFGQVTSGMDVVRRLEVNDIIRMSVKP